MRKMQATFQRVLVFEIKDLIGMSFCVISNNVMKKTYYVIGETSHDERKIYEKNETEVM